MMARKQLSDLLREEASKGDANQSEETPDAAAEAKPAGNRRRTTSKSTAKSTRGSSNKAADENSSAASPLDESAPDTATPTVPEAMLHEVKTALEQSQQREATLQKQLTVLQSQLDEQIALVKSLQADVQRAESLKTEIDEAKAAAVRLAESNTQLTQELEALRTNSASKSTSASALPAPIAHHHITPQEVAQQQARSLSHPVFPNASPPASTEPDVGWMD